MSNLFDRYFLVLAGRLAAADCGAVASACLPTGGVSLGWPLDLPEREIEPPARPADDRTTQDGSAS